MLPPCGHLFKNPVWKLSMRLCHAAKKNVKDLCADIPLVNPKEYQRREPPGPNVFIFMEFLEMLDPLRYGSNCICVLRSRVYEDDLTYDFPYCIFRPMIPGSTSPNPHTPKDRRIRLYSQDLKCKQK